MIFGVDESLAQRVVCRDWPWVMGIEGYTIGTNLTVHQLSDCSWDRGLRKHRISLLEIELHRVPLPLTLYDSSEINSWSVLPSVRAGPGLMCRHIRMSMFVQLSTTKGRLRHVQYGSDLSGLTVSLWLRFVLRHRLVAGSQIDSRRAMHSSSDLDLSSVLRYKWGSRLRLSHIVEYRAHSVLEFEYRSCNGAGYSASVTRNRPRHRAMCFAA